MGENFTDVERWERGEYEWANKVFYTVPLPCLMGKPRKLFEAVQQLRGELNTKEYIIPENAMMLFQTGFLKGKVLLEIQRPDEYDASVLELEKSQVLTEVHYGPLKDINKTIDIVSERVEKEKHLKPTNTFIWDFRHGPNLTGQRADRFVVLCQI